MLKPSANRQKPRRMKKPEKGLAGILGGILDQFQEARTTFAPELATREIGVITSTNTGIAQVEGLPGAGFGELLRFPGGLYGLALDIDAEGLGVVLLGDYTHLRTGDQVERSGRVVDVPVGEALLGRVVHPLGMPLDDKGPVLSSRRLPADRPAPAILDRAPVETPLQTGVKVIDAMVPIGRGQRELIMGDRQTGKTAIAIDTIINQRDQEVVCVYCAIGQRAASVAKVIAELEAHGAMAYTIVVVTEGDDAPGLIYMAPYAATSIAEYFMEQGRDVLIVYDDLTHHAWAYREISLLLRRPPGREAYPGDIFYIHSRLLERSTHLRAEKGGGSLTALPIIETEAQNIAAYIPTNLISITDGQVYLSPRLFGLGLLPAVDIGKSVSRVGGKVQRPIVKQVAGDIKLAYAQFEELEAFARFGTHLDEHTQRALDHGHRIRECLKQPQSSPIPLIEQVGVLLALNRGLMENIPLERVDEAEKAVRREMRGLPNQIHHQLAESGKWDDATLQQVMETLREALKPFQHQEKDEKTR